MNIAFQSLFQAILLLTLVLVPGRLAAQGLQGAQSPAAATAQPPRVPALDEIIPLATAVSGRLASLERAMGDGVALARVEPQLRDISARVDEYAGQFLALQSATGLRAGRLPHPKAEIMSAGDALVGVSKFVMEKVRTLGNLRKEWLAEQQRWNAWQAALLKDEPLEQITTTVTKTQGAIDTALGLLRQQLRPLLAIQEYAGTLQTRSADICLRWRAGRRNIPRTRCAAARPSAATERRVMSAHNCRRCDSGHWSSASRSCSSVSSLVAIDNPHRQKVARHPATYKTYGDKRHMSMHARPEEVLTRHHTAERSDVSPGAGVPGPRGAADTRGS